MARSDVGTLLDFTELIVNIDVYKLNGKADMRIRPAGGTPGQRTFQNLLEKVNRPASHEK